MIDIETNQAAWQADSQEHGIEAGSVFNKAHCCKTPKNVWELSKEEPPCHACPLEDFELFAINEFSWNAFQQLDISGREMTFGGTGFLREEAIDCYLGRHDKNDVEHYETIKKIDLAISIFRNERDSKNKK